MTDTTPTLQVTYLPHDPKTPNKVKALFNTTDADAVRGWLKDNGLRLIFINPPKDGKMEVAFKSEAEGK